MKKTAATAGGAATPSPPPSTSSTTTTAPSIPASATMPSSAFRPPAIRLTSTSAVSPVPAPATAHASIDSSRTFFGHTTRPSSASVTSTMSPPSPKNNQTSASSSQSSTQSSTSSSSSTASSARTGLHFRTRRIEQDYTINEDMPLGQGYTATVKLCTSKKPGSVGLECACKIIDVRQFDVESDSFRGEMEILSSINHPNIIRLYDVYQTDTHFYMVTELAYGGELFDRILAKTTFSERDAAHIARQILDAVSYLHARGICHRDLKPENIMFATREETSPIKLTDFGFAKNLLTKPKALRTGSKLGTIGYAAPEIWSGNSYDEKCDVWSIGIMVYIMLCGLPPFCDTDDANGRREPFWIYVNKMTQSPTTRIEFPPRLWAGISDLAKQFVSDLLASDPKVRLRSVDALKHPWIKKPRPNHTVTHSYSLNKHFLTLTVASRRSHSVRPHPNLLADQANREASRTSAVSLTQHQPSTRQSTTSAHGLDTLDSDDPDEEEDALGGRHCRGDDADAAVQEEEASSNRRAEMSVAKSEVRASVSSAASTLQPSHGTRDDPLRLSMIELDESLSTSVPNTRPRS